MTPTALLALNPLQIIGIWEDLMCCLFNKNRYGGTVAEIYLYRIMPSDVVSGDPKHPHYVEVHQTANWALYGLCCLFEKRHEVKLYLFEGEGGKAISLQRLIDKEPWVHRVHIGIKPKDVR